jgi:hypothetical protein
MRPGQYAPELQLSRWFHSTAAPSLGALRGRPVLLHAFQMLCPGCVAHAVPQAEKAHRLYGRDGLAVVGLHTVFEHHAAMTPLALEAFLHEYRITHPVGVDMPAEDGGALPLTMRAYAMQGTPTLVLIDRAGVERLHHFGQVDDLQLGVLLGKLLADAAPATPTAGGDAPGTPVSGGCAAGACPATEQPKGS